MESRSKQSVLQEVDGMLLSPFVPILENAKERLRIIRELDTRDDDIILFAYPKSGTHWVWEVLTMLTQGKAEYVTRTKVSGFLEALPDLKSLEEVPIPRVLNTHLPVRWLPLKHIKNGGKLIHVMRNPKDVFVSLFNHMKTSGESGPIGDEMQWPDFFKTSIDPGVLQFYGGWFAHEKELEDAQKKGELKSIHTVYYEEMAKDPIKEIRSLADYLQVQYTEQLIKDIADKTLFKNLKEADKTIKKVNTEGVFKGISPEHQEILKKVGYPEIYRKGEVGDWKNTFTEEQDAEFDAMYAKEMKNSNIKVIYNIES